MSFTETSIQACCDQIGRMEAALLASIVHRVVVSYAREGSGADLTEAIGTILADHGLVFADADLSPEAERGYLNRYQCPECRHKWAEVWDCGCDSECPRCGCSNITPLTSSAIE